MTGPPQVNTYGPIGEGDFKQWTASGTPVKPLWACVVTAGDPQFALFPNGGSLPKRDLHKIWYNGPTKVISLRLIATARYSSWNGSGTAPNIRLLLKVNGVTLESDAKFLGVTYADVEHSWLASQSIGDIVVDSYGQGVQIGYLNDAGTGNRLVDRVWLEVTALPVSRKRYFGPFRRRW